MKSGEVEVIEENERKMYEIWVPLKGRKVSLDAERMKTFTGIKKAIGYQILYRTEGCHIMRVDNSTIKGRIFNHVHKIKNCNHWVHAVSYTHLDVYKRQGGPCCCVGCCARARARPLPLARPSCCSIKKPSPH